MEKFNEQEVRSCYRFLRHEQETEIRILDPQRKKFPESIFVNNEEDFVNVCKKYNEQFNIYAGINERKHEGTEKKDVISVKTIVIDIDAIREKGYEKEPATFEELKEAERDCDEIIASMITSGANPPTKIFSGNGYQIWIAIPKIDITKDNLPEVETKLQMFQDLIKKRYEKFGSIDKIGDLPRIIKVWGTYNIKGKESPKREYRLCKILIGGERNEDEEIKKQIFELEEEKYVPVITPIDTLQREFMPSPISYLYYDYKHEKQDGWMRIIETLAAFFRGIGLNEEKTISLIIDWSNRQPYHESNEESEIISITKRIYRNQIACPNFKKLLTGMAGYPFFGLKDIFDSIKFEDDFSIYINPCKYYKEKKDRSLLGELEKLRKDVKTWLLAKRKDEATELITQFIKDNNKIYTTRDDLKSEVWVYKDGVYIPHGKSYIKEICRLILEENFTSNIYNDVINKIEPDTYIDSDKFFRLEGKDEIAVQNGILNIHTRVLSEFNNNKIFFNKLPVYYNPDAKCNNIDKFFNEVLQTEDDIKIMYELIGYCLFKEYRIEKAIMFLGDGRNGKGKTLSLIKRFLGAENCASVPLSLVVPNSTSVCELFGKLVNLAGDLSNTDLKDTGMFKQLTGRDLITAKRKYLRDLFFESYAKLVFACNELPKVYDLSMGFWSRWILIEFPYTFIDSKSYSNLSNEEKPKFKVRDEDILNKISSDEELSGLLNKALDGLDRLLKQRDFSYSKSTSDVKNLWIRKADSFTAFCIDNIEEDINGIVMKKELRRRFSAYCKLHKIKGASDKAIKVTLEDQYGASDTRQEILNGFYPVWEGIKFKSM